MDTNVLSNWTLAGSATALCAACGIAMAAGPVDNGNRPDEPPGYRVDVPEYSADDPYFALPDTLKLVGTVRDFRERRVPGGHPDMELRPASGFGHYMGIAADNLDEDGKPAFHSTGHKVSSQGRDAQGRPILTGKDYIASHSGDSPVSMSESEGGAITDADSYRQWFRDIPGVNMTDAFPIYLVRQPGENRYVFDDKLATHFAGLGGFFIVNDRGYGNSSGGNKNFHFTYELETSFTYREGSGQIFRFTGDDDVWVYIDGKLVIDIGGVHSAVDQTIDLDRLEWLQDGQEYELAFFFAERHRTQSNFRIETTIELRNANLPTVSALSD